MRITRTLLVVAVLASPSFGHGGGLDTDQLALRIDHAFSQGRTHEEVEPLKPTSDEVFLRRAYLEVVGRQPTVPECRSFLESEQETKRASLIDLLLDSPGHQSRMFNFWADLLRIKSQLSPRVSGAPYIHWLKTSIANGVPYDEMVRAMLTAEGGAQVRGNGATGFYLRDYEMPEDNMASTVSAFLGTQIQCAQCHDDPAGEWTRKQFFEMRAFTGGIKYLGTIRHLPNFDLTLKLYTEYSEEGSEPWLRAMRELYHLSMVGVFGSGSALVQLPANYQYEDGEPGEWVLAHSLFGEDVSVNVERPSAPVKRDAGRKPVNSRGALAEWLTSKENPQFTRSIVNRLWERAFGWALVVPEAAANKALLAELEAVMLECEYDLDVFLCVLYRTQAWQAEAVLERQAGVELHGPLLRRMDAEQVWDSILTMIRADLDETLQGQGAEEAGRVYRRYEEITTSSEVQLRARVSEVLVKLTGRDELNQLVTERRRGRETAKRALLRENQHLFKQFEVARREGDVETKERVLGELTALGIGPRANRVEWEPIRASELSAPAPNGHFLRRFGQSDREQINGASAESTVPQALALVNGLVEEHLIHDAHALLNKELVAAGSAEEMVELAFLAVFSRKPTNTELDSWLPDFLSDSEVASGDLVWSLINSSEFLFVR